MFTMFRHLHCVVDNPLKCLGGKSNVVGMSPGFNSPVPIPRASASDPAGLLTPALRRQAARELHALGPLRINFTIPVFL